MGFFALLGTLITFSFIFTKGENTYYLIPGHQGTTQILSFIQPKPHGESTSHTQKIQLSIIKHQTASTNCYYLFCKLPNVHSSTHPPILHQLFCHPQLTAAFFHAFFFFFFHFFFVIRSIPFLLLFIILHITLYGYNGFYFCSRIYLYFLFFN